LDPADRCRVASKPLTQIDHTVLPEGIDRIASRGVDLLKVVIHAENQPSVLAVLTFPVIHAAGGHPLHSFANPDLFARFCIERDDGPVSAAAIDDAPYHDRIGARFPVWIRPRNFELLNVRFVDLL
jgi:hypothetical protein